MKPITVTLVGDAALALEKEYQEHLDECKQDGVKPQSREHIANMLVCFGRVFSLEMVAEQSAKGRLN